MMVPFANGVIELDLTGYARPVLVRIIAGAATTLTKSNGQAYIIPGAFGSAYCEVWMDPERYRIAHAGIGGFLSYPNPEHYRTAADPA